MRPKLILHVGTEKTGSTSIQDVLFNSRDILLKEGILYPSTIGYPCHINLTACALDDMPNHPIRRLLNITNQEHFTSFKKNTIEALSNEINTHNPEYLIISDEHINVHLHNKTLLERYKQVCEEFADIQSVIIYLRSQDGFKLSMFSEAVKSGNLSNFNLKNPLMVFESIPYRFDYLSILNNLASAFGHQTIRPVVFDRTKLKSGNVVDDFLSKVNINSIPDTKKLRECNKSIDARIIMHVGRVSSILKIIDCNFTKSLRDKLINISEKLFSGSGPILDSSVHAAYMLQFDGQNKIIAEKYFPELSVDEKLFPDRQRPAFMEKNTYPDCSISLTRYLMKLAYFLLKSATGKRTNDNTASNIDENEIEAPINALCPVCGVTYILDSAKHSREGGLCPDCGASGRAQAIAYHLSLLLVGEVVPLALHQTNNDKSIIGLSDGRVYAEILERKYSYLNTFFHRDPLLDITKPQEEYISSADILISTEVFEHVIGESIAAFKGAYDVLKPGGYIILTVPYVNRGDAVEHYRTDVKDYKAYKNKEGEWLVDLEYRDGSSETVTNPRFHGGPGKTLEMRVFNKDRVYSELRKVGFVDCEFHVNNVPEYGINWGEASRVVTARKPVG